MTRFLSFLVAPLLFVAGLIMISAALPAGILLILLSALLVCRSPQLGFVCAFPSNCNGRIINVSASTGCTLTRADIVGLTPNAFENFGFTEIGMDKVYANLREARVAGYRENTLQALLMSRISNIKGQLMKSKISPSESVILPYISRRQKRNINTQYWAVASGAAAAGAGSNGIPTHAQDIVVQNNRSPFGQTLLNIDQYFLPGKMIFIEYATGTPSVSYAPQYRILKASTSPAGVTTVTAVPNKTEKWWSTASAASKLPYQIGGAGGGNAAAGSLAYLGLNSVSDFESWGGQDVAENTNSLIHFFLQTSRIVHEYTDEYLRALNAALTSNFFKIFRQLPLAEQKRIQQAKYDRDMLQSAFYGQAIDENQGVETYTKLPQVVDPANPNCVLEYKSNALGFRTLLDACGRVTNQQGNPLNMDTLLPILYLLKRAREAEGNTVDTIDIMTDRFTAGMLLDLFVNFYKAKYGITTQRFYQPQQTLKFDDQVELEYNVYELPPDFGGFRLAVFTHPWFDDKLAAMSGNADSRNIAGANRGRVLWGLDWTDIELGIAGTNSAVRRTNEADQLYNYVMRINAKHITLNSMSWCPIIEDPNRHSVVENFSSACPTLTVPGCTVTNT